ncbi:MAG: hypothetical protein LBV23_11675 [Deltaproteobacteria bacterium]|nr:hypothetical protein [Deltaproteobacteria bacterium]
MKIDEFKLDSVFLRPRQDKDNQAVKGAGVENFDSLLKAEGLKNVVSSSLNLDKASAALLSSSFLGKIQAGQALGTSETIEIQEPMDRQIGDLLEKLEQYAQALGDSDKSLKDIAPMAEELESEALRLDKLVSSLQSEDPLKKLGSDTATLAAVEALKFKRGDFI